MKLLIVLVVCASVVAIGWSIVYPSGTWRYKLTINVETPEGMKSGSAVREVYVAVTPRFTPEMSATIKIQGEAVIVDLGQRGLLFGLISADSYVEVFEAFPKAGETTPAGVKYYRSLKPGMKAAITQRIPRLIKFAEISKPTSAEEVNADTLADSFGYGVRLQEVTVEIVDEPIVWQATKYLPWLSEFKNKHLDGQKIETINTKFRVANSLSAGSFSTGVNE